MGRTVAQTELKKTTEPNLRKEDTVTSVSIWLRMTLTIMSAWIAMNAGFGRIAYAQSCAGTINQVHSWLTQNKNNYAWAVVASHKPEKLPSDSVPPKNHSKVTYSKIAVKINVLGWIVTDPAPNYAPDYNGRQFFSDRYWHFPTSGFSVPTYYPFSPDTTDGISLTIMPDGTVRVYPNNGQVAHIFTAACSPQGVMYGEPPVPGLFSPVPFYTITFEEGTIPPQPPPPGD